MPIDLAKIPPELTDAAASGHLVPFVGAGLSQQAMSGATRRLPTWPELMGEILSLAREQDAMNEAEVATVERLMAQEKYLIAGEHLRYAIAGDLFERYIERRFTDINVRPGDVHRALVKMRAPLIITTNYDPLLEQACAEVFDVHVKPATDWNIHEVFRSLKMPWRYRQGPPVIFKIHGTSLEPHRIVFGERDYYKLLHGYYRSALRTIFMTRFVLMLGFSFSDPDIADIMAEGGAASGSYILLPKGKMDRFERSRLSRTFGLEAIEYEPTDGLPEVLKLVEYLASFAAAWPRGAMPSRMPS